MLLCCDMGQGVCKVQGRCAESVANGGGSTNVAVCILMVLSRGEGGRRVNRVEVAGECECSECVIMCGAV